MLLQVSMNARCSARMASTSHAARALSAIGNPGSSRPWNARIAPGRQVAPHRLQRGAQVDLTRRHPEPVPQRGEALPGERRTEAAAEAAQVFRQRERDERPRSLAGEWKGCGSRTRSVASRSTATPVGVGEKTISRPRRSLAISPRCSMRSSVARVAGAAMPAASSTSMNALAGIGRGSASITNSPSSASSSCRGCLLLTSRSSEPALMPSGAPLRRAWPAGSARTRACAAR